VNPGVAGMADTRSTDVLSKLESIIAQRASAGDGDSSYTAKLLSAGREKCARKFGEEAIELILAAVEDDVRHLTAEAADVLYHLLVVLRAGNVPLDDVMQELADRFSQSGLQEKASRSAG
jgi:phosphoribosyl-ATP pyrophosphohydrolase